MTNAETSVSIAPARLLDHAATVLTRCDMLARCTEREGQITRTFLLPPMEACHSLVSRWMNDAGMQASVDRAGNLRGYYAAGNDSATTLRLIIASHLDTVPNAGRYDGILGVMLGIAMAEALEKQQLSYGLEIIGFSDEEGIRYGIPFIGSRALAGTLGPAQLARQDANGILMSSALGAYAAAHPDAIEANLHPQTRGYLEFHIEQGPVLEKKQGALGVVEAIAGQSRASVTFRGRAGHAGTTPMTLRHDSLAAAAEWIAAVESLAIATPSLVATVGSIASEPGATNVIPAVTRCSLDVRHAEDALRRAALQDVLTAAESIAARRQIRVDHVLENDQPAVAMHPAMIALAEASIAAAGIHPVRMVSGAGHDAMILAPHTPSAMIFLRSPGGISHHPDESVLVEDVAAALRAGLSFLHRFAAHLEEEK